MRNYFDVLRLDRFAPAKLLKQAIETMPPADLAEEDDIVDVLSNETRRLHYRRLHLQYDAIAAALNSSAADNMEHDAHSWHKRIVEFEPQQNTIELGNG